jgi:hypothetical protein
MPKPAAVATLTLLLVSVFASPADAAADFTVTATSMSAYTINGQANPSLKLVRGQTYTFGVAASGHPFWITTLPGAGTSDTFDTGVTNNGIATGTLTFTVPASAPATLYYQCQFHDPMNGVITIAPASVPASGVFAGVGLLAGVALVGLGLAPQRTRFTAPCR